jgi:prepilin peptidase CpaA
MQVGYDFAALVAAFTALCAVVDYRSQRIPNWLTVPAAVLGLAYNALAPHGIGLGWSLAGFAIGFALLILPWILGGGGMGDVKMLAALGAWLGPLAILIAFGVGSIFAAAGMMAVLTGSTLSDGFMATKRRYVTAGVSATAAAKPRKVRRVLPFAVPMALSTWLVLGWMLAKAAA